ncbi:hypothetical protein IQ254_13455 [Nodosilinea sp. LEGE 07088]|uniref:hypothetical protein n=1 Tax=Nodosilinea sp. LEGE 07088 TaxID=2777968 RepID=UPI00187E668E|nr:hypothetical protein [Nodosilinea sp. LEGE 07088]MBE9138179.1 hypothetical protein [Nodosilinea sp. LEGE 07088]
MASKSQPDKRQNRKRILFSFNVDLESALGVVFQYLMHNPKMPSQMGKQKGVEAIAAFWRPFAFQMQGQVNDDELKVLARESLMTLQRQMELIAETFEVELPQSEGVTPELEVALERTVERVLQRYVGSGALGRPATPSRTPAEGVSSTDPMLVPPGEEAVGFEQDMFKEFESISSKDLMS